MTRLGIAALAVLLLAGCGPSDPGEPLDAGEESRALAAYIETGYADYMRDYLHVFLGYASCSYGFIDEDVLNSLADDVLREMTRRGAGFIRERHSGALTDNAVEYAASMAVLTSVEMWANALTAEFAPLYEEGVVDCTASGEVNQARYASLRAFGVP